MRSDPHPLWLRHRFAAQGTLRGEASLIQFAPPFAEDRNRVAPTGQRAGSFFGKADQKPKPVLKVSEFDPVAQPWPIEIGICGQYPRQSFDETRVEIRLPYYPENNLGGIPQWLGPNVLKSGVAKRRNLALEIIGAGLSEIKCNPHGEHCRRKAIEPGGSLNHIAPGLTQPLLQLG
jgi:hypothetical protein